MTLPELYYSFPTLYQLSHLLPPSLFWRHRTTQIVLTELLHFKDAPGKMLEIGCGSGHLLKKISKFFPKMECIGIDSSCAMIAHAARDDEVGNLRFLVVDFLEMMRSPVELNNFEAVVSVNSWAFFPLEASIALLRKIVKQGTRFVAITYSNAPWSRIHSRVLSSVLRRPLYLHDPLEFVSCLNRSGFHAEYVRIDPFEGSYLIRAVFLG